MNSTFQHGEFYKITKYGRINPGFWDGLHSLARLPITLNGKGEPVWFVGLAWILVPPRLGCPFYLIASNFYEKTEKLYIEYDETSLRKRDRVKIIEPFTLKDFPLLIETKTTTLFSRFLKNEITVRNFSYKEII